MIRLVANAFSLNMLGGDADIRSRRVGIDEAREFAREAQSIVGHVDTAAVMSSILGLDIPCRRRTVVIGGCAELLVAQYRGPRLPEGATTLPEGSMIEWVLVTVQSVEGPELGTFFVPQ